VAKSEDGQRFIEYLKSMRSPDVYGAVRRRSIVCLLLFVVGFFFIRFFSLEKMGVVSWIADLVTDSVSFGLGASFVYYLSIKNLPLIINQLSFDGDESDISDKVVKK
jgi:hypothetical protein